MDFIPTVFSILPLTTQFSIAHISITTTIKIIKTIIWLKNYNKQSSKTIIFVNNSSTIDNHTLQDSDEDFYIIDKVNIS